MVPHFMRSAGIDQTILKTYCTDERLMKHTHFVKMPICALHLIQRLIRQFPEVTIKFFSDEQILPGSKDRIFTTASLTKIVSNKNAHLQNPDIFYLF